MSRFTIFDDEREDFRLVVVLQNEQASWYRWQGEELVGAWSEPLTADSLSKQSLCPWLTNEESGAECRVLLVLDTSLDEVDRVKVDGLSRGWMQAVQRRRMARRLRTDYPLASIHLLPGYASPDVLSIVHHLIPPGWEEWLQQLQNQGVCITHAVTSLELFCECTRYWPLPGEPLAGCIERRGGPVLFDVRVGGDRRHLLVDQGVPLFMRWVTAPDEATESGESSALQALQESLQHACDQIIHDERTPLVLTPVPPWPGLEQNLQSASILAALSVGSPVNLHRMTVPPGHASLPATEYDETSLHRAPESGYASMLNTVMRAADKLRHRHDRQQQWSMTKGLRFSGDFLLPSILKNRMNLRIRQLQKATLICAWLAAGSVVIASTHGISSARDRADFAKEQQQLSGQIDDLAESVSALNDKPEFIVRSLARIEAHESVKPVEAFAVLATVASAITRFPAIVLDRLSWSVMTDNHPIDLAFAAMSQVPEREQIWHSDATAPRLQVDISGTVTNKQGLGLREQQTVLQSFVDHLQAMPEIVDVHVLEAPVNSARSSDRTAHEGSSYHLSLQLGAF